MGIGCYGFYRNFNLVMGLAATIFIIIGSVLFIGAGLFEIDIIERQGLFPQDDINIGLGYGVATVTIGVALILLGVLFSKLEIFEPVTKLKKIAGIANIITGILFCTILLAIFFGLAYFVLSVTSIITAAAFFNVKALPQPLAPIPPIYPNK